jgi:hypothetical protein
VALIGTSHVSPQSAADVAALISLLKCARSAQQRQKARQNADTCFLQAARRVR